jgi:hypothetical protein
LPELGSRARAGIAGALAALSLVVVAHAAPASPPQPDAHDRALAQRLSTQVLAFQAIVKKSGAGLQKSIDSCKLAKQKPAQAFALVIAAVPALFTQIVTEYKPQIVSLRETVAALHPDAPVFRSWTTALGQEFDLLLQFDNGGKDVDICKAAGVLLDKHSTPADLHRVLGIDPALIAKIFTNKAQARLTKLEPQMTAFFVAAGLSRKNAKILVSSSS